VWDPSDPYNLDAFRLSQDYAALVPVKPILTKVPVRKPSKEWYVRTHFDPAYRLRAGMLELKGCSRADAIDYAAFEACSSTVLA
jgi:hypothetical protein